MTDNLICVDVLDRQTGTADKESCHRQGLLHRAFSVFLYDGDRLLLQRRAKNKYHSGGKWANSCCSHPRDGESLEQAVERRLTEELGVRCPYKEIGSFVYRHEFCKDLYEYEYDHVFIGKYSGPVKPNPAEIMDTAWVEKRELVRRMNETPDEFAVWFITALPMVLKHPENQK